MSVLHTDGDYSIEYNEGFVKLLGKSDKGGYRETLGGMPVVVGNEDRIEEFVDTLKIDISILKDTKDDVTTVELASI